MEVVVVSRSSSLKNGINTFCVCRLLRIYIIKGAYGLWRWFVLGAGVDNILVSKYASTQCTVSPGPWRYVLLRLKTVH